MLFHTIEFWIFFFIVLCLFYGSQYKMRSIIILFSSYIFYMFWSPKFIILILVSTMIDYVVSIHMPHASKRKKKILLLTSIFSNLGLLGYFKYNNFFPHSFSNLLLISPESFTHQVIIPVGISFYTFQSLSYTIDVFRGNMKPVDSFIDFALFVAFFPQLMAGPIIRAHQFFDQWFEWKKPTDFMVQEAIFLILLGLIKKTVFADYFCLISYEYFHNLSKYPGLWNAWEGLIASYIQIYCDFAGYSEIAIGCAKLLGFNFHENFRRPFLAKNISEIWNRWHISLSDWLRDYVYIPLGGNQFGRLSAFKNLIITMILGGLWHGAHLKFIFWGAYHGLLLSGNAFIKNVFGHKKVFRFWNQSFFTPLKIMITFLLFIIGGVFFSCNSVNDSFLVYSRIFDFACLGNSMFKFDHWLLIVIGLFFSILEEYYHIFNRLVISSMWLRVTAIILMLFCIELFSYTSEEIPFFYFIF